jgi:hypothetical protein
MKKKIRKFQEGGFTPEQEAYLGGADRTDPYILARMRKAVPDRPMPKPAQMETGEIRDETGKVSDIKRNMETGELYNSDIKRNMETGEFYRTSVSEKPTPSSPKKTTAQSTKVTSKSSENLDFDETGRKSDIEKLREQKRESSRGIRSKANREADLEKQRESTRGIRTMKSGGKVKSASSRADGCAIRGKTRA